MSPTKPATIPFRDQIFPDDRAAIVLDAIDRGKRPKGEDLVAALEQLAGRRLPSELARHLRDLSSGNLKKPRGRPAKSKAGIDWIMVDVDNVYPDLLQRYQERLARRRAAAKGRREVLPRGGLNASKLTYQDILRQLIKKKMVPNMTVESFMNIHSLWKKQLKTREFSEDFDLEFDAMVEQAVSAIKRRRPPPLSP